MIINPVFIINVLDVIIYIDQGDVNSTLKVITMTEKGITEV